MKLMINKILFFHGNEKKTIKKYFIKETDYFYCCLQPSFTRRLCFSS